MGADNMNPTVVVRRQGGELEVTVRLPALEAGQAPAPAPEPAAVEYTTIRGAAKMLKTSPSTVRRLIDEGKLPAVWAGPKTCRIPTAAVAALAQKGGI